MQITVDTEKDSPAVLSNVGKFLVLGYGTLADKVAIVAGATPQPGAAVVAGVPLGDDMPADDFEKGKAPADTKAAAVFGAAPAAPAAPSVPVPAAPVGVSVPVPPSPAAVPPVPAPIPPAPGVALTPAERDTAGVPYDARIHNKSRTKKQDGTWKLAKGIDPALVTAVMAEITGTPAAPLAPAPVPPAPAVPAAPTAPIPPAPTPPPPSVGSAAPAAAGPSGTSFREVMKKITDAQTAGRLTKAQVDHALAQVGFKPDELAPLVMPANVQLLAAFNSLIDAILVPA